MRAIDSVLPMKQVKAKYNFKISNIGLIISAMPKRNKIYIGDTKIQAQKQIKMNLKQNLKIIFSKDARKFKFLL